MIAIIKRSLMNKRLSILLYSLATLATVWLYSSIFPSIQAQSKTYDQIIKSLPKGYLEALGVQSQSIYASLSGFLSTEYLSFIFTLLLLFFVISFGGSSIAGEIEKRTLGLTISMPISRVRIFFAKYISGIIGLTVFLCFATLSIIPIAAAYHLNYNTQHVFVLFLMTILFGLAILSLSFFLSTLFSDKGKVYLLTSGILVIMYIMNVVAALNTHLDKLKYISAFYYFNAGSALTQGTIKNNALFIFIPAILIFTLAGAYWFNRRDISI